jgi:hypothetical protein
LKPSKKGAAKNGKAPRKGKKAEAPVDAAELDKEMGQCKDASVVYSADF